MYNAANTKGKDQRPTSFVYHPGFHTILWHTINTDIHVKNQDNGNLRFNVGIPNLDSFIQPTTNAAHGSLPSLSAPCSCPVDPLT